MKMLVGMLCLGSALTLLLLRRRLLSRTACNRPRPRPVRLTALQPQTVLDIIRECLLWNHAISSQVAASVTVVYDGTRASFVTAIAAAQRVVAPSDVTIQDTLTALGQHFDALALQKYSSVVLYASSATDSAYRVRVLKTGARLLLQAVGGDTKRAEELAHAGVDLGFDQELYVNCSCIDLRLLRLPPRP